MTFGITQLLDIHHQIHALKTQVLEGRVHPDTARAEIVRLKDVVWQNFDNIVDIVVTLAREARDDDE